MPWWTDWGKDAALAVLALYGAGLSTLNWLHTRGKEKRRVKVETAFLAPFVGDQFFEDHVRVIATNVGQRKVTVTSLGLELDGRRLAVIHGGLFPGITNSELPATLNDGELATTHYIRRSIGQYLLRQRSGTHTLIPYCEDSTGKIHRGAALKMDAEEMAKPS